MTKYKCGHKVDTIIMNESLLGLSIYLTWKDSAGYEGDKSKCFDCYLKKNVRKLGAMIELIEFFKITEGRTRKD